MGQRIEDYAVIGDLHTAALVGLDGSIDWLCLPHFGSASCFARLLGTEEHGYWRIAPAGPPGTVVATRRRYRDGTLVLETEFDTAQGTVRLIDCMPPREKHPQVVRMVEGVRGTVEMRMDLALRFDYGLSVPWVTRNDHLIVGTAGPNAVSLWMRAGTHGEGLTTVSEFTVREGEQIGCSLSWFPSQESPPRPMDAAYAVAVTESWWKAWCAACGYEGEYADEVLRSLVTLKALTYEPTGGIVAAATTSLPEALGGNRNWDYRYCWLRDATLTLEALMRCGFHAEAMAWRDWLLRATAGDVSKLQIMYGASGERRLDEWEVDWLPGYEASAPVRVGNAAAGQYQLDVYGEVMSSLFLVADISGVHERAVWDLQTKLVEFVESEWMQPDDGIWEVRGPRRHFTHSKVMAWVAVDRAVRTMEQFPTLQGPIDRYRTLREAIHKEICEQGWNPERKAFTQYYGSEDLDASVLMMPMVGFLPPSDPRVVSTVEAIERELVVDGFVLRYKTAADGAVDGLSGREGAFLACSFWLADCLHMIGRVDDAREMFERLLSLRNDVGLLSEEYDPVAGRLVGNFPQAFSHISLVNTACRLTDAGDIHDGHVDADSGGRLQRFLQGSLAGMRSGTTGPDRPRVSTPTLHHRRGSGPALAFVRRRRERAGELPSADGGSATGATAPAGPVGGGPAPGGGHERRERG